MKFKVKTLVVLVLIIGLVIGMVGCSSKTSDEIVVGGKNFTEQYIMAEMISMLIEEHTDLKTSIQDNLSASVVFEAIKADEVDIYLEYVGTGLINMRQEPDYNPEKDYASVKELFNKELNIEWLEPWGFNNTYGMVVTQEIAEKYNLKTISDLAAVADELRLGCTYVFTEREDGYPGLSKHYDFEFKDVNGMEPALMYQALEQKNVEVISGFATDGEIAAFNLILLEDDKNFFPPYHAAPIIRNEVLEKHPELEEIMNKLSGKIDDLKMAELNSAVDLDKKEPKDVVREFLEKEGLLSK